MNSDEWINLLSFFPFSFIVICFDQKVSILYLYDIQLCAIKTHMIEIRAINEMMAFHARLIEYLLRYYIRKNFE